MDEEENQNIKLLKAAFSKDEWEHLIQIPEFNNLLNTANKTVDDFENLATIGGRILIDLESDHPLKRW
jgi:hypothetical protein